MAIPNIAPYSLDEALSPCEEKVSWTLYPDRAVLLVHDMQAYFANFYDCKQEPITHVIKNIQAVVSAARTHEIPVAYTAQPTDQRLSDRALLTDFWGKGIQESHQSHHILSSVAPLAGEKVYTKWRYSAFQKSSLDKDLREQNKTQIIICGVYAHIGILSTALEAFMRDYQCFVIEDAVADFSLEEHLLARKWISGRCGKLINTASTLNQINLKKIHIVKLVSEILEISENDIQPKDNLADWGLDSIRLMTISDRLKASGYSVDFISLAENPSIQEWEKMIESRTEQALVEEM